MRLGFNARRMEALTRRQLLDAARIEVSERVAHAHAGKGALGRDFGERNEHEGALE
jgi:hypothetical protein